MKKQQDYKTPVEIKKLVKVEQVKPTFKKRTSETQNHDLNKYIIMITAAGVGWWLFR